MNKVINFLLIIMVVGMASSGCSDHRAASPKPRTYPRVDLPDKAYIGFSSDDCPFGFDIPDYSAIEKKESFMEDKLIQPCWFDLVFPVFNGRLHCSYYEINETTRLDSLIYDSFALVGKHTIKAQYIEETPLKLLGKGGGMLFRISGPVATPTQFFVTDSSEHFLRGSLYFYNEVEVDSMRMIYDFINEDIDKMLQTFYWE